MTITRLVTRLDRCWRTVICIIAIVAATSCASNKPSPTSLSENSHSALITELEQSAYGGVMLAADLASRHTYGISQDSQEIIHELASKPGIAESIVFRYRDSCGMELPEVRVETVFLLLDILLQAEDIFDISTVAERKELWKLWGNKYSFEMSIWYSPPLQYYEDDIRNFYSFQRRNMENDE